MGGVKNQNQPPYVSAPAIQSADQIGARMRCSSESSLTKAQGNTISRRF